MRIRRSRDVSGPVRLHLGPGAAWTKPDDTWLSVDVDPRRGDIHVNFGQFDRLPVEDGAALAIYGSHVFEHISPWHSDAVFAECARTLAPGCRLRIVLPDVRRSIEAYLAGDDTFPLFVRRRARARQQYGDDYTLFDCLREDFISRSGQQDLLGDFALAHQNAWDFPALEAALRRAGFGAVERRDFQDVGCSDFEFEGTYPSEANESDRSLYAEAVR